MNKILLSLYAMTIGLFTYAQNCSNNRFSQEIFSQVNSTLNVEYGRNLLQDGVTEKVLEMDIYAPQGDLDTDRPLIILAHGGAFVQGDRSDVAELCKQLARMGYVTAAISYRLLTPDLNVLMNPGPEFKKEVVRALHDTKAAIRFFRKSVANGNTYGINPELIIVGGISAGAILANHAAYMDTDAKIPADLVSYVTAQGGLEGTSGNPGFSSKPKLVISLCGAIMDTTWIQAGAQPNVSIHNTGDEVVPNLSGQPNITIVVPVTLMGDSLIHKRSNQVNIPSSYMRVDSEGHCVFPENAIDFVVTFVHNQICLQGLSTENNAEQIYFSLYPNPSKDKVFIDVPANQWNVTYTILDVVGKTVLEGQISKTDATALIDASELGAGLYTVVPRTENGKSNSKRLLVN